MPATPLWQLTEEQMDNLVSRPWDGAFEYFRFAETHMEPPPGATWPDKRGLSKAFPITFDTFKYHFLTTLLVQYRLFRQETTMCGVPALEDHSSDDVVVVTSSTETKTRHHQRRLKTAPSNGPWSTYETLTWENTRTASPDGYHHRYTAYNTTASYPTCSIDETQATPPVGWDGSHLPSTPSYALYDWRIVDDPTLGVDNSTVSYEEFVGTCLSNLKDALQNRQRLRSFSPRKAAPVSSHTFGLQGIAGSEDLTAEMTASNAAGAYGWTADLWATGQRMPFKLCYTEEITWLYTNGAHDAGDLYSSNDREIHFNHTDGWHHSLEPPLILGCKTALVNPHVEIYDPS